MNSLGYRRSHALLVLRAIDTRITIGAVVALLAIQAAHLLFRPKDWIHDVPWAVDDYNFSLILFGPACAGLGAWIGRHHRRVTWLSARAPTRGVVLWVIPLLVLALVPFLVGLFAAISIAAWNGAPIVFAEGKGIDVLVALVGVMAYSVLGFMIGHSWPSLLSPAGAAVGSFTITMLAWVGGNPSLVEFGHGGALGHGFSLFAQVQRLLGSLGLIAVGLGVVMWRRTRTYRLSAVLGGVAFSAALLAGLMSDGSTTRRTYDIPLSCSGRNPTVCVAERTSRYLESLDGLARSESFRTAYAWARTVRGARSDDIVEERWPFGVDRLEGDERRSFASLWAVRVLPPFCAEHFLEWYLGADRNDDVRLNVLRAWLADAAGAAADVHRSFSSELQFAEEMGIQFEEPPPRPAFTPAGARWVESVTRSMPQCT